MKTHERDEAKQEPARGADIAPAREEDRPIPAPSAEEVPELLGERSDCPVPFGEPEDDAPREGRVERPPAGRAEPPRPDSRESGAD
jgi:hypothetical protein